MKPKKIIAKEFEDPHALLKKHIPENGKVILGLSGGADSIYLLHLCLQTQKGHPFIIIVAHVNHGLRGRESDSDESFSKKLAQKHALPFFTKKIRPPKKGNTEEKFREARYLFFENLRVRHNAALILTAHHLNDNLETVLLNLVRGCHLDGLKGMEVFDPKRHLLRPLLNLPKSEILLHLNKQSIAYREDSTNCDPAYSRNLIRLKVIPELKKINKNLEKTFRQNIKNFKSASRKNDSDICQFIASNSNSEGLKTEPFIKLKTTAQKNIIFGLYKKTHGNLKGLSQNHVAQIIKIITQNRVGLKKEFGPRHVITVKRSKNGKTKYIRILKKKSKQVQ